jgi:hypothetical protein
MHLYLGACTALALRFTLCYKRHKQFCNCSQSSVLDRVGGLDEDEARWLFQQLILGVDFCHKMNVCIRDIKVENILLDSPPPNQRPLLKICDFGHSFNQRHSLATCDDVGTPGYRGMILSQRSSLRLRGWLTSESCTLILRNVTPTLRKTLANFLQFSVCTYMYVSMLGRYTFLY